MENRSHFRVLLIFYLHGKYVSFQSTTHIIFTWKIGLISEYYSFYIYNEIHVNIIGLISEYYSYYIYMENRSDFRVLFILD